MHVAVITPPAALVTASEAKLQAPVFAADDDQRVTALLSVAQSQLERSWIGRAFGAQTLELRLDGLDEREIMLPWPPLRRVLSIVSLSEAGEAQAVDPASYLVFGVGSRCGSVAPVGGRWPSVPRRAEAIRIRFEAGYAADDPALAAPRHAVILIATQLRSLGTQDLSLRSEEVAGIGATTWTVSDAAEKLIRSAVDDLLADYAVWSC
ncbi:hypothetical protein [Methylobacterium soli]|uniref:Uncharacterized protein n=1 Tax=Methylobacterium soli TaxID=553447 RepID=A0A6L3T4J6_9HYPH|nr:hypothetical protein [Methylobacterium soli]KAB1081719.1 hypothetical protein F6X53_01055 [Methylobacterium soli]GJE46191.1 hypothetical protein AEGHOMDF_5391 [Methylobacterium soli]